MVSNSKKTDEVARKSKNAECLKARNNTPGLLKLISLTDLSFF
jgi:hypothetical protein